MIFSEQETNCLGMLAQFRLSAEATAMRMAHTYVNTYVRPELEKMLVTAGIVAEYHMEGMIHGIVTYSYNFYDRQEWLDECRAEEEDDEYWLDEEDDREPLKALKESLVPDAIIAIMDAPASFGFRVRDLVRIRTSNPGELEAMPQPTPIEFSWRPRERYAKQNEQPNPFV